VHLANNSFDFAFPIAKFVARSETQNLVIFGIHNISYQ